jgi:hypothetical protein
MMRAYTIGAMLVLLTLGRPAPAAEFVGSFARVHDRVWVGPDYWANPMEDWRVQGGRLECVSAGPNRNVQVLTRQAGAAAGTLEMRVRLGRLDKGSAKGAAGFRLGIRDEIDDYRSRLIYGKGLNAGVTTEGALFVGNTRRERVVAADLLKGVELRLAAKPNTGGKTYIVALSAHDPDSGKEVGAVALPEVEAEQVTGNLALVNNPVGPGNAAPGKKGVMESAGAQFWFEDWRIDGSKVESHDEQRFGPILWTMYTLSQGILKMTVQMPPLGEQESQTVQLLFRASTGWKVYASARMDPLSRTVNFRVPSWDAREDIEYAVSYQMTDRAGESTEVKYHGTVRKDPVARDTLVVAGMSCIADFVYPNRELVRSLKLQDPDMLFFAGDQVYEQAGGYGILRTPVDRAILNYLRKWYLFGWAFRDLMRDRVTVVTPDDHDVYQGNYWGNGGNPITLAEHEAGGYVMHRDFVSVVHKTQTSHLPDPFDPTPIKQDLSVYYGPLVYGRIGFAIISDRMFKSGPRGTVATWLGRPDHLKDPKVDVRALDKPGLQLLGERQEKFLRAWGEDWKGVDLKCVLSQTNFCNVANYHGADREFLIADLDSGGWPQTPRNRAVDLMRRCFALHLCGDQHLPSLVQYGIEAPGDANFGFCVPAGANVYPRAWQPDKEGVPVKNRPAAGLPNTGDYLDGLGNPIRVYAVGNPQEKYRAGRLASMQDKSCGHGIVRFNRKERTMTVEAWRLLADVTQSRPGDQFPGWPFTIKMLNNDGRKPAGHLPTIVVTGVTNPVVQVIDEAKGDVVYTLRIQGDRFRPMVFAAGRYSIRVSEPETGKQQVLRGVAPTENADEVVRVQFGPGS